MFHIEPILKTVLKFKKKCHPTSLEKACESLVDNVKLYAVAEFRDLMSKLEDNIYSQK